MRYIIDVKTKGHKRIMAALRALKSTVKVEFGGEYHEDRAYCQIHLESSQSEDEIDNWLWKRNFDYVGVVPRDTE